jgi:hypothetical protein
VGQPIFEDDVAVLDIAEIVEPRSECIDRWGVVGVPGDQDADARDFRRDLLCRRWFGRDEQGDKRDNDTPPLHPIITWRLTERSSAGSSHPSSPRCQFFVRLRLY